MEFFIPITMPDAPELIEAVDVDLATLMAEEQTASLSGPKRLNPNKMTEIARYGAQGSSGVEISFSGRWIGQGSKKAWGPAGNKRRRYRGAPQFSVIIGIWNAERCVFVGSWAADKAVGRFGSFGFPTVILAWMNNKQGKNAHQRGNPMTAEVVYF
jgi:hypothetical protein